MKTFFTSDPHFGHANIIKYCNRPFADVQEMNETLITNWNSVVGAHDEVWSLGDIFFCEVSEANNIMSRLNGSIHLILGNHDKLIRNQRHLASRFASVTDGIKEIDRVVDGQKLNLVLCHYPLLSWNRAFRGSLHLHGHCHGNIPHDPQYRRQDVGVDVWNYSPVSLETLATKLLAIPAAISRDR